jgi:hypothetical protein
MTLLSRVYYGCAASRNKVTCTNRLTMRLDRLEEAVLCGLQSHLLTPELTATFVREYTAEVNRLGSEAEAIHSDQGNAWTWSPAKSRISSIRLLTVGRTLRFPTSSRFSKRKIEPGA